MPIGAACYGYVGVVGSDLISIPLAIAAGGVPSAIVSSGLIQNSMPFQNGSASRRSSYEVRVTLTFTFFARVSPDITAGFAQRPAFAGNVAVDVGR